MNEQSTDRLDQLGELAETPILRRLWEHFPENMFVVRVEPPDEFIIEAANPSERKTLGFDCEGKTIREFVPASPDTSRAQACEVAERLRQALERHTPITVSIGITESQPADRHLSDLATRADQLLLGAKRAGRNRLMGEC